MNQSTAEQMRRWNGPAILSFGFRPLFLLAGLWAAIAMTLWIGMLSGLLTLPTRFDPITWHAHEFLFGYLSAVIAGFLLTAVPNWTGRLPVVGWALAGLSVLWILGRLAIAFSQYLPAGLVAVIDLSFLFVLSAVILREILAGKNWNNMPVLILIAVLIAANGIFHLEVAQSGTASFGYGVRLALSVALVLISLIGGKVTPSFTRNWLVKRGETQLPTPPMRRFDKVVILATIVTLLGWVLGPQEAVVGAALVGVGALHFVRLVRWKGHKAAAEPLVLVLHVAYGFVPFGAMMNGAAILWTSGFSQASTLHIWTAGAIGLMTLAVMTRASLGHSGRELQAGRGTALIYSTVAIAVFTRLAADLFLPMRMFFLDVTALLWIAAFLGFVGIYGPMLIKAKVGPKL